jgi:hypothetical protein
MSDGNIKQSKFFEDARRNLKTEAWDISFSFSYEGTTSMKMCRN